MINEYADCVAVGDVIDVIKVCGVATMVNLDQPTALLVQWSVNDSGRLPNNHMRYFCAHHYTYKCHQALRSAFSALTSNIKLGYGRASGVLSSDDLRYSNRLLSALERTMSLMCGKCRATDSSRHAWVPLELPSLSTADRVRFAMQYHYAG